MFWGLALIVLVFLGWLWWLFSGWVIRNKSSKYYSYKKITVFLIPVLALLGVHLVEFILFRQACEKAVVHFPESKYKKPEVIITNSPTNHFKNKGRYFDGMFKYIVSPHYLNNREINLHQPIIQFSDYLVYPYKSKKLEGSDRVKVLNELRYVFVFDLEDSYRDNIYFSIEHYIYDFKTQKKISQTIEVIPKSSINSFFKLFNMEYKQCFNSPKSYFNNENFIKNTFIMEDKL